MSVPVISPATPQNQDSQITLPPLLGAGIQELTAWVEKQGQPAFRAKQLHDWIYNKGVHSFADIGAFPKEWRSRSGDTAIGRSIIHHRSVAPDGAVKYLLKLEDEEIVEAVGIPTDKRLTVCVSTQVGCPMACNFCATGKGGFRRNLHRHEIVDQVLTVQEDWKERVSNVVFMGMGEPLLNTNNVIAAVKCLNKDIGIGQRSLTLSTVGIRDQISKLAEEKLQITLAVSLHAPNQELREELIPSARPYPIEDLLEECREYVDITGRRLSFEYILLAGVNDFQRHAEELAKRIRGFQCHVNLIPYNPIQEADYKRPTRQAIETFTNILKDRNIAVSVRYSRGLEADAACGQLRRSSL
jgi:23S rRNA (adenine2503-C2)-methyltransferase